MIIGGFHSRLFGPSRSETRAAVEGYRDLLRESIPGETFPVTDLARDYEDARQKHGWPPLDATTLLRELEALGIRQFMAIKVPWAVNGSPPPVALPKPAEPEGRFEFAEPAAEPFEPEPVMASVRPLRTVRIVNSGKVSKAEALADLQARLARGETIPSQQALAESWGRAEGTVSDWMSAWRRAGLIPQPVRDWRSNSYRLPNSARAA